MNHTNANDTTTGARNMGEQCAEHNQVMREFARQLTEAVDRMEKANGQLHLKVSEMHDALLGNFDKRGLVTMVHLHETWIKKFEKIVYFLATVVVIEFLALTFAYIKYKVGF